MKAVEAKWADLQSVVVEIGDIPRFQKGWNRALAEKDEGAFPLSIRYENGQICRFRPKTPFGTCDVAGCGKDSVEESLTTGRETCEAHSL